MRTLAVAVMVAALAGVVGAAGATPTSGPTALVVTYWADGAKRTDMEMWTLRCNPPGGTLGRPVVACRRLEAGGWKLVVPVPAGTICTEIYGGPQEARIVGVLNGRRVFARFSRENGCQITRWNRLSPWLFPPGGVTR